MKNKLAISAAILLSAVFSQNACASSVNDDTGSFYIGVEGGMSAPVVSKFKKKIEGVNTTGTLKKSPMYGALMGYKFYPGMAIEFSWQRKPNYRLNIAVPDVQFTGGVATTKKFSGDVKVESQLFLVGIVYDLEKINNFTPYIGVEFGVANIKVKEKMYNTKLDVAGGGLPAGSNDLQAMKIKKSSTYSPAFQLSLGVSTPEIIPNVSLYATTRLQIIYEAKMKYNSQNMSLIEAATIIGNAALAGTPPVFPAPRKSGKFKQTILVGEVALGVTYNLPF
ncbi:MAG: outer membrane beta-barrel protein [Rickettsiaceae bacterium]|nr:outer membrane beta-barrel protein [Rickettsiaceae bacterium]